jgi:hypothetical protein
MTIFTKAQIIEMAKEFAEANYDQGMSYFVECYENEDWLAFVGDYPLMKVLSNMVESSNNRAEFIAEIEAQ